MYRKTYEWLDYQLNTDMSVSEKTQAEAEIREQITNGQLSIRNDGTKISPHIECDKITCDRLIRPGNRVYLCLEELDSEWVVKGVTGVCDSSSVYEKLNKGVKNAVVSAVLTEDYTDSETAIKIDTELPFSVCSIHLPSGGEIVTIS